MKVVINRCYGGFELSDEAGEWLIRNKGWKASRYLADGNALEDESAKLIITSSDLRFAGKYWLKDDIDDTRIDKDVIECIEVMGSKANGSHANLVIVEIPDGVEYEIDEYDGIEVIHEKHRSWC